MKRVLSFFLVVSSMIPSVILALNLADQQAITQIVDHYTEAWNVHGGRGAADNYSPEADFVNIFGMALEGKEEIEQRHIQVQQTFLKGSKLEATHLRLREEKPDVVVAHVYWSISQVLKPGSDSGTREGILTHVLLKNEDRWKIIATQNTLILK